MSIFASFKRIKKGPAERSEPARKPGEEVKPWLAPHKTTPQKTERGGQAGFPTRWSPKDTEAKIAEARRNWDLSPSSALRQSQSTPAMTLPRAKSELVVTRCPVCGVKSNLPVPAVVKQSSMERLNAPVSNHPPPVPLPVPSLVPTPVPSPVLSPVPSPVPAPSKPNENVDVAPNKPLPVPPPQRAQEKLSLSRRMVSTESSNAHPQLATMTPTRVASIRRSLKRSASLMLPRVHSQRRSASQTAPPSRLGTGISSPYNSSECWTDRRIPTWRYEDLTTGTLPPKLI
jgi:hypothetical protein